MSKVAFYDYECPTCGDIKEVRHSIKAEPTVICKICGCTMKRLISSGINAEFVGTGFYQTDYKKKKGK